MNIIVGEIRVKRGLKANLPVLNPGEPAYCTDTKEYYIGTPEGNVLVGSQTSGGGDTGGGGSVPSNVILFEDWTEGETVVIDTSTTPTDTTAPVLTITAGGTFTGTKTVSMTVNETADIFFTLDGSTPTTASTKYTAPLSISATTTLKAFARDTAGNVSTVQTVTYTLDTTTPADTTAPNNVTNLQATPTANSVALSWTASASSDVASYDIYNGSTLIANVTGTSYNVTGLTASTAYTFSVRAKDGANNVASGTSVTTTTLAPADTTAPVLTITPAATFSDTQTVTMSVNETATIWYTVDGSDPTASGTRVQYTTTVTLTATTTMKAYAVDSANNASAVQTVTYTKQQATGSYVNDSSLKLFQASPVKGSTIDETNFKYFQTNEDWTFEFTVTMQHASGQSNPAAGIVTRNAAAPIRFEYTWQGKWASTLTGTVNGTASYPTVSDVTAYTGASLPKTFHVQYVLNHTSAKFELYVNGVKVNSAGINSAFTIDASTNGLLINNSVNIVSLANMAYYNRALSDSELTQNYNALK